MRSVTCAQLGENSRYCPDESDLCDGCMPLPNSKELRARLVHWALKLHTLDYLMKFSKDQEAAANFLAELRSMEYVKLLVPKDNKRLSELGVKDVQVLRATVAWHGQAQFRHRTIFHTFPCPHSRTFSAMTVHQRWGGYGQIISQRPDAKETLHLLFDAAFTNCSSRYPEVHRKSEMFSDGADRTFCVSVPAWVGDGGGGYFQQLAMQM